MNQNGINDSSSKTFSINFRTINNKIDTLKKLNKLQILEDKCQNDAIRINFFSEHNAPIVMLKTNLSENLLKFLIDTGAAVSLIAENVIPLTIEKTKFTVNIFGIMGKTTYVKTRGIIHCQ